MDLIDFRSDTVTHPTPKMRHAMMEATVGDDVYGDDPTVNKLQEAAAKLLGKEAAILVSSGTMGNLTSLMAHCGRGERAIMGNIAHIHKYEAGNQAVVGGIPPYPIPVQADGTLDLQDLAKAVSVDNDPHFPITKLVCLENTQGSLGGIPLSIEYIESVGQFCLERDLKLHMDGARLFNAVAAIGADVKDVVNAVDSVTFCLSKGLCAPVGSIVVGDADFIQRVHRIRKMLGGAMRQAGIIAAAGLIALEDMTERLVEDHKNAKMLAEGLTDNPYISLNIEQVQTNMIFFELSPDAKLDGAQLSEKLRSDDIILTPDTPYGFRAVTHYWITPERVEFALERIHTYLS